MKPVGFYRVVIGNPGLTATAGLIEGGIVKVIKSILRFLFKFILASAALVIIALSVTWSWKVWQEQAEKRASRAQYGALVDSTQVWVDPTFGGIAGVKLKYVEDNSLLYQLDFTCDEGYEILSCDRFTVTLLDKDGFKTDYIQISDFTRYVENTSTRKVWTGVSARGSRHTGLKDYGKVTNVSVAVVAEFGKLENENTTSGTNKKSESNGNEGAKAKFDESIENWNRRAKKIVVGMTYAEMVRVAGSPREQTEVWYKNEWGTKYNYGDYWVYFKDRLVDKIDKN